MVYDGVSYQAGDTVTFHGLTSNGQEIVGDGFCLYNLQGSTPSLTTLSPAYSVTLADLKFDTDGYLYIDSKHTNDKRYYGIDTAVTPTSDPIFLGTKSQIESDSTKYFITRDIISGAISPPATNSIVYMPSSNNYIDILTGYESQRANKVSIHFADATMQGLFSDSPNISVLNESSCDDAIDKISGALKRPANIEVTLEPFRID